MNPSFSKNPDISKVNIFDNTKVRVRYTLENGIVVTHYRDNTLGFISNKHLKTSKDLMYAGKSLYVVYLGQGDRYLYFAEGDSFEDVFYLD